MTGSKKQKSSAKTSSDPAPPDPDVAAQDENAVADAAAPAGETAPAPVTAAPAELDQLKERLLRLQADFDNYRKRMVRERQETIALANADLLCELMTPLDHMDRAIETMARGADADDACVQGIRLVRTELLAALGRFGLQPMETSGQPFDPTRHEALGWAQVPGVEDGRIAMEMRAGYLLNGRVLRAAQVLLAGAAPEAEPAADKAETATNTEG